ncbi:MAG: nucleoside-diphosphate sugar epimerase [Acidobacteria bacterium]|nr:MAG: nucleoside-diphosphate sugar epimerase [Acidobacteriota bacterium]
MKILITGGAGFIGSHLAERHLERGDEICVIDDLSTGSIQNIQHLKGHPNFNYYIDDVTHYRLMAELIDQCDIVYHLAAAVGVRLIVESPVRTIETNLRCTEVVLNLAAKKRKRVLITSTSEVYGKREHVPFKETDDLLMGPPDKGRWSYACSKAIDEFLALAYWREKEVPAVVLRLFNTVGPRQTGRYGMVIPNFVRQALSGQSITVYGNGSQRRCFAHVSDVVGAMIQIVQHPSAVGNVYNLGSNQEVTILELAERVKQLTASDSPIVLVSYDKAYEEGFEDMMRRVPDLSKVQELIGYSPRRDLDTMLQSVIDYERSHFVARAEFAPGEFAPAIANLSAIETASS